MEFFGAILLRPWWLSAVPIVLALGFWRSRKTSGLAGWDAMFDPSLKQAMTHLGHVVHSRSDSRFLLPFIVASILPIALAGIALDDKETTAFRNLDVIVIAMDMSASVTRGNSLDDAQAAAAFILQRSAGRPVALILFTGESYLASAPTTDPSTIESLVAVLDEATMPDTGSQPLKALAMGRQLLAQANIETGDFVLVSDGGGLSEVAFAEVEKIRAEGGHVSAIHITPISLPDNAPAPDIESMKKLAELGGGTFTLATDPSAVAAMLTHRSVKNVSRQDMVSLLFRDYGRFIVVFALVPGFLLFRKKR